jgi:hypothetical protein
MMGTLLYVRHHRLPDFAQRFGVATLPTQRAAPTRVTSPLTFTALTVRALGVRPPPNAIARIECHDRPETLSPAHMYHFACFAATGVSHVVAYHWGFSTCVWHLQLPLHQNQRVQS